jgi:RND family efflux transporter MFP subunit
MKVEKTQEPERNLPSTPDSASSSRVTALAVIVLAAVSATVGYVVWSGVNARAAAAERLSHATEQSSVPVVSVVHPKASEPIQEIALPGNAQAFTDSPIYARTNGYLTRWYFDIGARVKKGDLLAEIETPEIDRQLQQARADLETAQANYHLAQTTAARWQFLLKSNSVSAQETDQAVDNMAAQKAAVDAKTADVHRLEELQSFEKVFAPFDGIITARNTDVGALIDAGSSAQSRELFHLAAIGTLRIFVPVPEVYSSAAQTGAKASLTLEEYPGRTFSGTIVRNANAIDTASRTLMVEVDVDNSAGKILPGAYVFVHLKVPGQARSVTVPANTLLFRREGLRAAVVRDGHAVLTPVVIGRDYGSTVEIVSGLQPDDEIVLDPSDSLMNGAQVRLAAPATERTAE